MVRDAYTFIIPLLTAAALLVYLGWWPAALAVGVLAAFVAFFFRNPERTIPTTPGAVVSPADGKIIRITPEKDGGNRVSIFLSVFDVHVNRAPIAGRVQRQVHQDGRFRLAFDDRASVENEQLQMTLRGEREISFALIAGLVARRIVPWTRPGDVVKRGDRIGLIRFGSRVDIVIPADCRLQVQPGERVKGGSTILAVGE